MRGHAAEAGLIDANDPGPRELEEIFSDAEAVAVDEAFAAEEPAVEFGASAAFVDEEEVAALTFDDGVDLGDGGVLGVEFEARGSGIGIDALAAAEDDRGVFQGEFLHRPATEDG